MCTGCGLVKPLTDFPTDNAIKSGRKAKCRICAAIIKKDWRMRTLEENPTYDSDRRAENPEKHRIAVRKHREKHRDKINARARELHDPIKRGKSHNKWYYENGGKESQKIKRWLYGYIGTSSTGKKRPFRGYLKTQGICIFCGELHPLMLENCHIFPDDHELMLSLCYNCHKKLDRYPMLLPSEYQYQK